jgi:hypothetical protein
MNTICNSRVIEERNHKFGLAGNEHRVRMKFPVSRYTATSFVLAVKQIHSPNRSTTHDRKTHS